MPVVPSGWVVFEVVKGDYAVGLGGCGRGEGGWVDVGAAVEDEG